MKGGWRIQELAWLLSRLKSRVSAKQIDEIVATGYNGAARNEQNCCDVHTECPRKNAKHNSGDYSDCPAVHAEQNALLSVSRDKAIGAILYLNGYDIAMENGKPHEHKMAECEPCPICKRMIMNAGISEIIGPQGVIWRNRN